MKQSVSPALAIGAIVVVVIVVAFIGYKTLFKPRSGQKFSGQDYQAKMAEMQKNHEDAMRSGNGAGPGGPGGGSFRGGSGAGSGGSAYENFQMRR